MAIPWDQTKEIQADNGRMSGQELEYIIEADGLPFHGPIAGELESG